MKYVVVLGDGMSDYPVAELGDKTPLEFADKPNINSLARRGILGLAQTVPAGMSPGSDTANLSVLGYDPRVYYSGRSPFEAASMGIQLLDTDVTFRCNFITLSAGSTYEDCVMLDHSADEITTDEARQLLSVVSQQLIQAEINFYAGVSYRHLMVWQHGPLDWNLTPPHDILGRPVKDYLPKGDQSGLLTAMMKKSAQFLPDHAINKQRVAKGLRPANAIWIWGEGKKPRLTSFQHKYGLKGAVISAVDLIKGLGLCAGLESINVVGATGNLNTNFVGKAEAALQALARGLDFVYIHIEAPDECGHRQEVFNKVKAIELIDQKVVKTLVEGLDRLGEDYRIMILPDHATPLSLRTHTMDPVPFLIYQKSKELNLPSQKYDEAAAMDAGLFIREGYTLMDIFLEQAVKGA